MTEQAMSPLRRRMIEDMTIRKLAPKTQHNYVQRVKDFATFFGRSPDTAKSEDVRGFRLHLASSGAGTPKINATVSALRFFFNLTLDRPDLANHLSFMREPRKVPRHWLRSRPIPSTSARVGVLSVLHTSGSALTHHPHVHMIVPGGGISPDGSRWISCRPGFFLPVRVLSRLFRRLFLQRLIAAHQQLAFFGNHARLAHPQTFATYLAPLRKAEWVVYSKRPFGGPEAVLAYLSRYTHRVAISNSRLIGFDHNSVTFKWKDYRIEGRDRYKRMTLATDEFIRRFLIHVLPHGFHRIRHYGLFASAARADNLARARQLLAAPAPQRRSDDAQATAPDEPRTLSHPCPCCGGRMIIIESFERGCSPRFHPAASCSIDTS